MSYNPYEFYINFKKDNIIMQIEEPFMFDAFSHSMERKKGGFAIDVCLFAENTDLLFTNSVYSQTSRYEDIDGTIMFNLSHGLKRIIDSYQEYGPDGEIELIINFEGALLTKCDFDLEEIDSDLKSYFKCGFIENNKVSKHKIREDNVIIDVYSGTTIDGADIQVLQPKKVLLRNKPTLVFSKWIKTIPEYTFPRDVIGQTNGSNNLFSSHSSCNQIISSGISNTLSPLHTNPSLSQVFSGSIDLIRCTSAYRDIEVKITSDMVFKHVYNGRTGWNNRSKLSLELRISTGQNFPGDYYNGQKFILYSKEFIGTQTQSDIIPNKITYTIPNLVSGQSVMLFWFYEFTTSTTALYSSGPQDLDAISHIKTNDIFVEFTASQESINSVVQGVRWIDMLKKSSEIISGLQVDAPRIDIGGEYYDTIICNGGGIRNISGIPFKVNVKDIFNMGQMVAMDYQITNDKILVGEYKDFFSDKLLKTFNIKPDEKFLWNTNKDYRIKTFNYEFKNYEQDRQEQRTLDAVHTQEQILMPNLKTTNTKDVKIDVILDAYKIDSLRRLGVNPETVDSSLENDTDLVMLKVLPLDASHTETYTGLLISKTVPSGIKLHTTDFRWDKLGLGIGDIFDILTGPNATTCIISKIEAGGLTVIRPIPYSTFNFVPDNSIIKIRYFLNNVQFQSQTDQGFSQISGVLSKETYTNLFYSKFRNIQKWLPFLATCSMRYVNGVLKVSFLKSNQELSTRLTTEVNSLVEKADIDINSISELKRVTDRKFNVNIYPSDPSDIIDMFESMNVRNDDGSIGGYYGFLDNNGDVVYGYPEKLEYVPAENKLEATCVEKYEKFNGVISLLEADKELYSQYTAFGIYITVYNADGSVFIKEKRFNKIRICGQLFTDISTFLNNIELYFS